MQPAAPPLDVTPAELEALLEGVREALGEAGYQKLKAAIRTLSYVTELLENREATLQSLRRLLCRARSEKTEAVLEQAGIPGSPTQGKPAAEAASKKPAVGHGRNGAQAYRGAHRIEVPHPSLHQGDRCPECQRGKVYPLHDPGLLVRMRGQAPIAATVYELQKLRCNLCGEVFTAEAPAGVGGEKYDATAASMIALLRYGSGFPWNRLADLEESLGIPLPVATQCEIVTETAATIQPAMEELIRQAAQGEVLHNDDTSMPVLALRRDARTRTMTRATPRSARECSPAGLSRPRRNKPSRYSSPDASTRARTWRMCSSGGLRNWLRPCRCATRCRATCPSYRRSWRSSWAIVWLMLDAVLWR